jgi:hypothetical protein
VNAAVLRAAAADKVLAARCGGAKAAGAPRE